MHSRQVPHGELPLVTYMLDLSAESGGEFFLSPAFRDIFPEPVNGWAGMSDLHKKMHPNDASLLKNRLFTLLDKHLNSIRITDLGRWIFSINYRLGLPNGSFVQFLDEFKVLSVDNSNKALIISGMVSLVAGVRMDHKIIFTATRIGRDGVQIFSEPVLPSVGSFFSKREKEILSYIINGLSSKQIANLLNLSINTVHNHRKNMLAKTNTHNTAELIRFVGDMEII